MKYLLLLALLPLSAFADLDFETLKRDTKFADFMSSVDLDSSSFTLNYKDSGTSVGMKIEQNGEKVGKWVPTNSATNPEAQVVSYYIARALGMSEQVVPSAYYVVGPRALETFRTMLLNAKEKNKHRIGNRDLNLKAINSNPNALLGVYTDQIKNEAVDDLVNWKANTINVNHPIAKYIRANGPMPTTEKRISFKQLKNKEGQIPSENELELSRQFSRIMVLDILCGQWDRWSGGNVEVTVEKKTLRAIMLARDNGGAGMNGTSQLKKYFGIVSRFDRDQIARVGQLLAELDRDPAGTAKALGLRSNPKSLRTRAAALLEQVDKVVAAYGEDKAFFPN